MNLLLGIILGVAYIVPPGPVNIETVRRGITGGVRAALAIQLGALLGDLAYAALALAGVGLFLEHKGVQLLLGVVCVGALVMLGWSALRSFWSASDLGAYPAAGLAPAPHMTQRGLWTGFGLSIMN